MAKTGSRMARPNVMFMKFHSYEHWTKSIEKFLVALIRADNKVSKGTLAKSVV